MSRRLVRARSSENQHFCYALRCAAVTGPCRRRAACACCCHRRPPHPPAPAWPPCTGSGTGVPSMSSPARPDGRLTTHRPRRGRPARRPAWPRSARPAAPARPAAHLLAAYTLLMPFNTSPSGISCASRRCPISASILCTNSTSYCVTKDTARPARPARAVRPTLQAAATPGRRGWAACGFRRLPSTNLFLPLALAHPEPPPPPTPPHHQTPPPPPNHQPPPVHIVARRHWQVVVDHQIHGGDVQAARGHVRGQQQRRQPALEVVQGGQAQLLALACGRAGQGRRGGGVGGGASGSPLAGGLPCTMAGRCMCGARGDLLGGWRAVATGTRAGGCVEGRLPPRAQAPARHTHPNAVLHRTPPAP